MTWRKILLPCGFTILFCVVVISCIEIVLRISGISYPLWTTLDSELGWSFRPKLKGLFTREGAADVIINSAGFNAPEFDPNKPHDHLRIAIVGDSLVAAFQVEHEQHFAKIAENDVRNCLPTKFRSVDILPFGVNGYNTIQKLYLITKTVTAYKPDVIIMEMLIDTDLPENTNWRGGEAAQPYATLAGDTILIHNEDMKSPEFLAQKLVWNRKASIINNVHTLQVLIEVKIYLDVFMNFVRARFSSANQPTNFRDANASDDTPAKLDTAWRVMQSLLKRFKDLAEEAGARSVLMPLSTADSVHPDPRKRIASEMLARMKTLAGTIDLPLIDLVSPLAESAENSGKFYHNFDWNIESGHYNVDGHQEVGRILARSICGKISSFTK